jgi:cold shock CspA family protein
MPTGKIKWFNHHIGAGFIRSDEGENVFFRFNALQDSDPQAILKGQSVRFDIAKNIRSLSLTAARVTTAGAASR